MGCSESKDAPIATLVCFCEVDNQEQKNYCLKLKENYVGEKPIKYEIKQIPQIPFGIKLRIKGKIIDVQKIFDNREETMNETLNKIYEMLDKKGIQENEKEEEKENE